MKTATQTADRLAHVVGDRAQDALDAGASALHAVSDKARQLGRGADGYVRANPWLAIGAAAGVGLLAGFLLRGRRES